MYQYKKFTGPSKTTLSFVRHIVGNRVISLIVLFQVTSGKLLLNKMNTLPAVKFLTFVPIVWNSAMPGAVSVKRYQLFRLYFLVFRSPWRGAAGL